MINIVLAFAAQDNLKVRVIFSIGEKLRWDIVRESEKKRKAEWYYNGSIKNYDIKINSNENKRHIVAPIKS